MNKYQQPLSVSFVWHPEDDGMVEPIVDYCYSLLSRDVNNPFSRSMNMPVFIYRSKGKKVPAPVKFSANKNIVFVFIGTNMVTAGKDWGDYIDQNLSNEQGAVIPIALDKNGFNMKPWLSRKNFIRMYEMNKNLLKECMFISIAHEIYRFSLCDTTGKTDHGSDKAIEVFISHAKDGKNGLVLAQALKDFISNSTMKEFFDATGIGGGEQFDNEIISHIKTSTVVLIQSDVYSSRYWCQKEVMSAKEFDRPMVAVDVLEAFEDRRFPYSANIPCINVQVKDKVDEKDILRILIAALLETLRFQYARCVLEQYKKLGLVENDTLIIARPPEVADFSRVIYLDDGMIKKRKSGFLYPEPTVYAEELEILKKLEIEVNTPLTLNAVSLDGLNIGISISNPSDEEMISQGMDSRILTQLSQDFVRHLLARDGCVIYGGDLRPGGFTEYLFNEAHVLQDRTFNENIKVKNFIAWPIYNNDSKELKEWKAKHITVAEMCEVALPKGLENLISEDKKNVFVPPDTTEHKYLWSKSLSHMRKKLVAETDIRISVGGRLFGYKGIMPGVLEEIIYSIESGKPIFLLGGFGGVVGRVCRYLETGEIPGEITLSGQLARNSGYGELLDYYRQIEDLWFEDYVKMLEKIRIEKLNNGLSYEENRLLFRTTFVDEAVYLVLKGLLRVQQDR